MIADRMVDLEAAKQARTSTKRLFTKTINGIKRVMEKEDDVAILESRFSGLKNVWKEVQEKHKEYVMLLATKDKQQAEDSWIEELDDIYSDIERKRLNYVQNHKEREEEKSRKQSEMAQKELEKKRLGIRLIRCVV